MNTFIFVGYLGVLLFHFVFMFCCVSPYNNYYVNNNYFQYLNLLMIIEHLIVLFALLYCYHMLCPCSMSFGGIIFKFK